MDMRGALILIYTFGFDQIGTIMEHGVVVIRIPR